MRRLLRLIAEKELKLLARPAASVDGWRNLGVPDEALALDPGEQEARRTAFVARVAAELAPYVAAAMQRKRWMAPLAEGDIPVVKAYGRPDAQRVPGVESR